MLDAKIKEQWLTDLRSGEFQQCRQAMKTHEGFCCLAVLAHRLDPEAFDDTLAGDGSTTWKGDVMIVDADAKRIGLTDQYVLMNMNDSQGKTFLEIADYIEENL